MIKDGDFFTVADLKKSVAQATGVDVQKYLKKVIKNDNIKIEVTDVNKMYKECDFNFPKEQFIIFTNFI